MSHDRESQGTAEMRPELQYVFVFLEKKKGEKVACLLAKLRRLRLRYLHWHVFVFPSTFIGPAGRPACSCVY